MRRDPLQGGKVVPIQGQQQNSQPQQGQQQPMNESQLKKIVAESIKNVLTELDWKTYANAAEKSARKGETDYNGYIPGSRHKGDKRGRAVDFANAATKAFNDKYGHGDGEIGDPLKAGSFKGKITTKRPFDPEGIIDFNTRSVADDYNENEPWNSVGNYFKRNELSASKRYVPTWNQSRFGKEYQDKHKPHRDALSDYEERGNREIENYFDGNYTYDNEKGWHLKESQLRNIVAKNMKKVLKEVQSRVITLGEPEDGRGYHVTIALDSLGPYAEFDVYGVGTDAQAAVDGAVDYLEKHGEDGYFWDEEEIAKEYPDDFFYAGNSSHLLRRDLVHIKPLG